MKEVVCKKISMKKSATKVREEIIKYIGNKYIVDDGDFHIFYIDKVIKIGRFGKKKVRVAEIFWGCKNNIEIFDEEIYKSLKKFGNKNKYKLLTKCWEGAI